MAIDDGNIITVQHSGTYSDGAGDDVYVLSGSGLSALDANANILITDGSGANKLLLEGGLSITSSSVFADAVQFNLSNGSVVQVLAASSFTFFNGGSPSVPGAELSYAAMVSTVLGVTLPTTGSVQGGVATIGGVTLPSGNISLNTNDPAIATDAADVFTFNPATVATDGIYNLTGFDVAKDKIIIDLSTLPKDTVDSLDDLAGISNGSLGPISVEANPFTGSMVAIFGNDAATGKPIQLEIAGVSDASLVVIEII